MAFQSNTGRFGDLNVGDRGSRNGQAARRPGGLPHFGRGVRATAMSRLMRCCAAVMVAGVTSLTAQPSDPPRFRVDVSLVRLQAIVKDTSGQPVGDLTSDDFEIYDNGVLQRVALFAVDTQAPLSIALLVDTSASTAIKLREETQSVVRFLDALLEDGNPGDRVSLYSFSHEVVLERGFTRDTELLESELKQLKGEAGTSLYDAIYFASRALESRDGRRVILVVTDGADTTSGHDFHSALEAAHSADTVIYGIVIVPVTSDAGRHVAGENALTSLAVGTGGRVVAATWGDVLDSAFTGILRDLRTEYLLGFYPRNVPYSTERFHQIEVKTQREGLQVFTRNGYYGE